MLIDTSLASMVASYHFSPVVKKVDAKSGGGFGFVGER
jgi:hypothetical protein